MFEALAGKQISLESSFIHSCMYWPFTERLGLNFKKETVDIPGAELGVEFVDRMYMYDDVSASEFVEFLGANSHGVFFNRHLRDRFARSRAGLL